MRPRTLSGREISRLGLGCSRLGSFNNRASDAQQRDTVRAALDLGVTLFDTADVYGQGDSERMLGRLLKARREDVFLVTKIGKRFSAKARLMRPFKPLLKPLLARGGRGAAISSRRGANIVADFVPARFAKALEASLARLGFAQIDALLLHSPPAAAIGAPGVATALGALVERGQARFVGISCDDRAAFEAAVGLDCVTLLELPIDLIETLEREGALAGLRQRGVAILAREIISLRPDLAPLEAVREAAARPGIDSLVIGASHPDRVRELIAVTC